MFARTTRKNGTLYPARALKLHANPVKIVTPTSVATTVAPAVSQRSQAVALEIIKESIGADAKLSLASPQILSSSLVDFAAVAKQWQLGTIYREYLSGANDLLVVSYKLPDLNRLQVYLANPVTGNVLCQVYSKHGEKIAIIRLHARWKVDLNIHQGYEPDNEDAAQTPPLTLLKEARERRASIDYTQQPCSQAEAAKPAARSRRPSSA